MPQYVLTDPPPSLNRTQIYRRRRLTVFGAGGVFLVALLYLFASIMTPLPATAAATEHQKAVTQSAAQLEWPDYGSAAITAPDYAGATMYHGSGARIPIASLTKVITALVVLDAKPIDDDSEGPTIAFTQKDVDIWQEVIADGGSWAPVVAGTSLTEKQVLTAMLVPSANNYAISLTNWAFGSASAYVKAANSWLKDNGFTGTTVVTSDGLDPGNVSTTEDLIGLGALVLASPVLSSIVSQKSVTLPGAGVQENTNVLLGTGGVDGLKTGNTDEAGFCLLFSAEVPVGAATVRVFGVVLGAPDRDELWAGVTALLTSMQEGFHDVEAVTAGQVFGSYATPWGATSRLVAVAGQSLVVFSDTSVHVDVTTQPVRSGLKGDVVGQLTVTANDATMTVDLALAEDVPDPGFGWRLAHPAGIGA